jgi:hypothetical protein
LNLTNKVIVIGKSQHVFTKLYIDLLIFHCEVESEDIVFLTLDNCSEELDRDTSVIKRTYTDFAISDIEQARNITFISLNKENSFLVDELLSSREENIDKTFIHMTEDELSRWVKTKEKYGFLKVDKKNFMSENCLSSLKKVKKFISSDEAFRKEMVDCLGRDDFEIINARDAFSVLPSRVLSDFAALYKEKNRHNNPENKILIGGKRNVFKLSDVISILKELEKKGVLLEYKYMIFTYHKRKYFRILLDLYCVYLRHIKRKNIDISYPTVTNSITYNSLIMSCSHFILQDRGSMTTVKEFIRMKRGYVHVRTGSRNQREITDTIKIDVEQYQDYHSLVDNIVNPKYDIDENSKIINEHFERSYATLSDLYK